VKSGIPLPMQMALAASSALKSPMPTQTNPSHKVPSIKIMDNHSAIHGSQSAEALAGKITTASRMISTPDADSKAKVKHDTAEQRWAPKSSLSLRSRHKGSPQAPSTRPRGKTVPLEPQSQTWTDAKPQTPDNTRERDRDTDSVLSFTPSMSGKNLANWFSGLLGR
jgi:hypothetical protein